MRKISIIFSADFQFQIIGIVLGGSDKAWDVANAMSETKKLEENGIEHYDVVEFSDQDEMNQWILQQVGEGREKNVDVNTKEAKISRIKEIIGKWGETTTADLIADHSPCISSVGNKTNVSVLVERFGLNDVGVFTYVGDVEESEDDLTYEELEEDVIDDILDLLEDYDTDNFKTMKRCED
jgi:hypothetical protein